MQTPFYLVVGGGSIARRHIKNLKLIFPEAKVACVSASGRSIAPEECGADAVYSSLPELLALGKPEFAVIASPAPYHLNHACMLQQAGVATLIEKPLADSLSSVKEKVNELMQFRSGAEVAYNLRYFPSAVAVKRAIEEDVLGKVFTVMIDVGQYLPDWRPQSDYRQNVSARRALGGGVLLELSHEFDYLTWIFGRFDSAYCITSQSGKLQIDVEDSVDAILRRQDGLVALIHMDFLQRAYSRSCKVIGEHGTLHWDLARNSVSILKKDGEELLYGDDSYDRNEMYISELKHFSGVAKEGSRPSVTIEDGIYILHLIDALNRSSLEKQVVSIEDLS